MNDQVSAGLQWVRENHASHYGTYSETDMSASRFARKSRSEFTRLLADLETGAIRVLWMWELTRSQRRLDVYVQLRDLCRRLGVVWILSGRMYDLNQRADLMTLGMLAVQGEDTPEFISESVRRGLASSAAAGRPHSHTRYGYQRHYDERTGKLVSEEICEAEACHVREAYRRVLGGDTLYEIETDWDRRGIRTRRGTRWSSSMVKRMLLNPAYIGQRVHHGTVAATGIWPAITDDATYYGVKAILTAPERAAERPSTVQHLLSGLVTCGAEGCGAPVRVTASGSAKRYVQYRCTRGAHVALRKEVLEEYVTRMVLKRLAQKGALKLFADPRRKDEALAARGVAAAKRDELREWLALAKAGKVSPMAFAEIEPALRAEIDAADERANALAVDPILAEAARPDIADIWPGYPLPKKRAVIRAMMSIELLPVGKGRRPFDRKRVRITRKA